MAKTIVAMSNKMNAINDSNTHNDILSDLGNENFNGERERIC